MPRKANPVREAVRDIVTRLMADRGGKAADVASEFKRDHSDLLDEFGKKLALDSVVSMARDEFKGWQSVGSAKLQMTLPGLDAARFPSLPAAINIPVEGGETMYRPIHKATIGELRACVTARRKQLRDDAAVLNDLRDILEGRVAAGAEDEDPVFIRRDPPCRPTGDGAGAPMSP